jgi:hypothetical protein
MIEEVKVVKTWKDGRVEEWNVGKMETWKNEIIRLFGNSTMEECTPDSYRRKFGAKPTRIAKPVRFFFDVKKVWKNC